VCNLLVQVLLGLVIAVTLRSKSCRTGGPYVSHLRPGSLSVASYDSQAYAGDVECCWKWFAASACTMGKAVESKVKCLKIDLHFGSQKDRMEAVVLQVLPPAHQLLATHT
jgi:hypothetical protein